MTSRRLEKKEKNKYTEISSLVANCEESTFEKAEANKHTELQSLEANCDKSMFGEGRGGE